MSKKKNLNGTHRNIANTWKREWEEREEKAVVNIKPCFQEAI
jgi:hypothetical protein